MFFVHTWSSFEWSLKNQRKKQKNSTKKGNTLPVAIFENHWFSPGFPMFLRPIKFFNSLSLFLCDSWKFHVLWKTKIQFWATKTRQKHTSWVAGCPDAIRSRQKTKFLLLLLESAQPAREGAAPGGDGQRRARPDPPPQTSARRP